MTPINVLIVDDDPTDRYVTRRQLGKDPQIGVIVELPDGSAAYEMFNDGRFEAELGPHPPRALVLLDINMPKMSGFELLDQLEADGVISTDDVSVVVMLTSSAYFGDRERSNRYELVSGFVEKPLTPEKIRPYLEQCQPAVG